MKQLFAIFDFDGKSYPVTNCVWNYCSGELTTVIASTPYNREQSAMDFVFDVVAIDEHEILLEGVQNKKFTAKIRLK